MPRGVSLGCPLGCGDAPSFPEGTSLPRGSSTACPRVRSGVTGQVFTASGCLAGTQPPCRWETGWEVGQFALSLMGWRRPETLGHTAPLSPWGSPSQSEGQCDQWLLPWHWSGGVVLGRRLSLAGPLKALRFRGASGAQS